MTRRRFLPGLSLLLTLVLLAGMTAERLARPTAEDAEDYHAHVRSVIDDLPLRIGAWQGEEVPVPPAAIALLKPNALCSRRYVNRETGQSLELLIVHCRDARDMAGHFPPICYPAHGWSTDAKTPCEWDVPSLGRIPGMQYAFSNVIEGQPISVHVTNLLVLPDGRLVQEMGEVRRLAADYRRHFYGAGQVQIVMTQRLPERERGRIVKQFLEATEPVIAAITREK